MKTLEQMLAEASVFGSVQEDGVEPEVILIDEPEENELELEEPEKDDFDNDDDYQDGESEIETDDYNEDYENMMGFTMNEAPNTMSSTEFKDALEKETNKYKIGKFYVSDLTHDRGEERYDKIVFAFYKDKGSNDVSMSFFVDGFGKGEGEPSSTGKVEFIMGDPKGHLFKKKMTAKPEAILKHVTSLIKYFATETDESLNFDLTEAVKEIELCNLNEDEILIHERAKTSMVSFITNLKGLIKIGSWSKAGSLLDPDYMEKMKIRLRPDDYAKVMDLTLKAEYGGNRDKGNLNKLLNALELRFKMIAKLAMSENVLNEAMDNRKFIQTMKKMAVAYRESYRKDAYAIVQGSADIEDVDFGGSFPKDMSDQNRYFQSVSALKKGVMALKKEGYKENKDFFAVDLNSVAMSLLEKELKSQPLPQSDGTKRSADVKEFGLVGFQPDGFSFKHGDSGNHIIYSIRTKKLIIPKGKAFHEGTYDLLENDMTTKEIFTSLVERFEDQSKHEDNKIIFEDGSFVEMNNRNITVKAPLVGYDWNTNSISDTKAGLALSVLDENYSLYRKPTTDSKIGLEVNFEAEDELMSLTDDYDRERKLGDTWYKQVKSGMNQISKADPDKSGITKIKELPKLKSWVVYGDVERIKKIFGLMFDKYTIGVGGAYEVKVFPKIKAVTFTNNYFKNIAMQHQFLRKIGFAQAKPVLEFVR